MIAGAFRTAFQSERNRAQSGGVDRNDDRGVMPKGTEGIAETTWSRLMASAQRGDGASYVQLLQEIMPLLRRVTRRRWPNAGAETVEDIVQDVLLSLHAVRHTYTPGRPFEPWLMGILRHRLADSMRRSIRHSAREMAVDDLEEIAADMPVETRGDQFPDHATLHRAIACLPPAQRRAVELLKLKELSLREAAVETGLSIASLKVATHRALKTLRAVLGRDN